MKLNKYAQTFYLFRSIGVCVEHEHGNFTGRGTCSLLQNELGLHAEICNATARKITSKTKPNSHRPTRRDGVGRCELDKLKLKNTCYCIRLQYTSKSHALTLLVGWWEGHPACEKTEWWGACVVICLKRGADLHTAQLMPLPLTVSCFSKIQIGFYLSGTGSSG